MSTETTTISEAHDVLLAVAELRTRLDDISLGGMVDGTPADRALLAEALRQLAQVAGIAKQQLFESVFADIGIGEHDLGSVTVKASRSPVRSGWDKQGMRAEIDRYALGVNDDGEITHSPVEAITCLWEVLDIATGRTKVLGAVLGGDLDEYCKIEWKNKIEVINNG